MHRFLNCCQKKVAIIRQLIVRNVVEENFQLSEKVAKFVNFGLLSENVRFQTIKKRKGATIVRKCQCTVWPEPILKKVSGW